MKITITLVADCDPPPNDPVARSLAEALDDICSELEDKLAELLFALDAVFSIDATQAIVP